MVTELTAIMFTVRGFLALDFFTRINANVCYLGYGSLQLVDENRTTDGTFFNLRDL